MADDRKLKPFIVFKGVLPIAALAKVPGVVVCYSRNGWMNEELTVKLVDSVRGRLRVCRVAVCTDSSSSNRG